MAHVEIARAIYGQFQKAVEAFAAKKQCPFNKCKMSYDIVINKKSKQMIIVYKGCSPCGNEYEVKKILEFSKICFDNITCPNWVEHITREAQSFVCEICPKNIPIEIYDNCCPDPVIFVRPFEQKITTTVYEVIQPPKPQKEYTIVYQGNCCDEPQCERKPIVNKHIVKRLTMPLGCNDPTPICKEQKYGTIDDHPDYNHHLFGGKGISKSNEISVTYKKQVCCGK